MSTEPTGVAEGVTGGRLGASGLDPHRVQQLLTQLAHLLDSVSAPEEFYTRFLAAAIDLLGANGGALWQRSGPEQFRLQEQLHLESLGLDETNGWDAHAGLLRVACRRGKALWVAPQSTPLNAGPAALAANLTTRALLFAPVLVEGQVAGLVEVWLPPPKDPAVRRSLGQLLGEMTGFLAAYQQRVQWRELTARQQIWERLEAFARHVHGSLDPRVVAYAVANDGRPLVEVDQLTVLLRRGPDVVVEAVSGAPGVETRSELIRALASLGHAVGHIREPLIYEGKRDESLPPRVLAALDEYLARSGARVLALLPLHAEEAAAGPWEAALLAESFEATGAAADVCGRLEAIGRHAGPALRNALAHERVPLRCLARPLTLVRTLTSGRGLVGTASLVALTVCSAMALISLQVPLRLEAKGQLLPEERRVVHAPLGGRVIALKAQHGDVVEKGQELLQIEDLETQLQVDQLALKVAAAEQRLAFLAEQLGKSFGPEKQDTLVRERIDQEYELHKARAERDILLRASRSPLAASVTAPLAGKVITPDAREVLLGKTVKPGDPLLRVAQVRGEWEVLLALPEVSLAPVREGLAAAGETGLEVDLLLQSHPHRTLKGRLMRDGLGGETTTRDQATVLPVRVRLDDDDLRQQLDELPVGVEVRARVHCGPRPVGYVWFHEVWDFVYEHLLF